MCVLRLRLRLWPWLLQLLLLLRLRWPSGPWPSGLQLALLLWGEILPPPTCRGTVRLLHGPGASTTWSIGGVPAVPAWFRSTQSRRNSDSIVRDHGVVEMLLAVLRNCLTPSGTNGFRGATGMSANQSRHLSKVLGSKSVGTWLRLWELRRCLQTNTASEPLRWSPSKPAYGDSTFQGWVMCGQIIGADHADAMRGICSAAAHAEQALVVHLEWCKEALSSHVWRGSAPEGCEWQQSVA